METINVKRNYWFDWDLDILAGNARYFIPLGPRTWEKYDDLMLLIKQRRPDFLLEMDLSNPLV